MTSGIKDLLVLKTTGSAFESFVRDEYTTLVEVNDRIFSTSIDLSYKFAPLRIPAPADGEGKVFDLALTPEQAKGTAWDGDAVSAAARGITIEVRERPPATSLEEAATLQGLEPRDIAKSVVMRAGADRLEKGRHRLYSWWV